LVPLYRALMGGHDWHAAMSNLALVFSATSAHTAMHRHRHVAPVFACNAGVRAADRDPPWLDWAMDIVRSQDFGHARAFGVHMEVTTTTRLYFATTTRQREAAAHVLGVRIAFNDVTGRALTLMLARGAAGEPFGSEAEWALGLIGQHLQRAAAGLAP
jgi:hypothetical protein